MVDSHSKWIEVKNATSLVTMEHFRTMFATHGLPEMLVTDNGTPFVSEEIEEIELFYKQNGIRHVRSAPQWFSRACSTICQEFPEERDERITSNSSVPVLDETSDNTSHGDGCISFGVADGTSNPIKAGSVTSKSSSQGVKETN